MANTTKITFECSTLGGTKKLSYNYVDPNAAINDIKALRNALVTNGAIFNPAIQAVTGAYLTTTTQTDIDFGD